MWHLDLLVFNFCGSLFRVLCGPRMPPRNRATTWTELRSEFTALGGRGNRTNNVRTNIENLYLRWSGTRSYLISRLGPTRMTVYCRKSIWSLLLSERRIKNSNVIVPETMEDRLYREANCPGTLAFFLMILSRYHRNVGVFHSHTLTCTASSVYGAAHPGTLVPFRLPETTRIPLRQLGNPQRASTADHEIGRQRV
jgi:hypothetical protein